MLAIRPRIVEPVFTLYSRPLHPEFFEVVAQRSLCRKRYEATVAITHVGHVLSWTDGCRSLTEVTTSLHHELPRLPLYRETIHAPHKEVFRFGETLSYRTSYRLETLEPETFYLFDKEFCRDELSEGLVHRFGQNGRVALGAVSYIRMESREKRLFVQAVHTFPDDLAFLRTESTFQLE